MSISTTQLDIIALTVIVESRPLWVLILALTAMLASMLPPPGVLSAPMPIWATTWTRWGLPHNSNVLWEPMLRRQPPRTAPMPSWATMWTRWGLPHNSNVLWELMLRRQVRLNVPMPIWATMWTRWGLPHNSNVLWEPMLRRQVRLNVPMPIWVIMWTRWGLPHNRNAKLGTMLVRQALPRVWHVLVLLTKDGSTQKQAPQNALKLQLMHSIQVITKIE